MTNTIRGIVADESAQKEIRQLFKLAADDEVEHLEIIVATDPGYDTASVKCSCPVGLVLAIEKDAIALLPWQQILSVSTTLASKQVAGKQVAGPHYAQARQEVRV